MGEIADSGGRSDRQAAEEFTIPTQLRQAFFEVPSKDRLMALAGLLRQVNAGCWAMTSLSIDHFVYFRNGLYISWQRFPPGQILR